MGPGATAWVHLPPSLAPAESRQAHFGRFVHFPRLSSLRSDHRYRRSASSSPALSQMP